MSVNNIQKNFEDNSQVFAGGSKFFDERTGTYKGGDSDVSYFDEPDTESFIRNKMSTIIPSKADYALLEEYSVPLDNIREQIEFSISAYDSLISNIDSIMEKINVDHTKDPNLEEAHKMLWREVVKFNDITTEYLSSIDKKSDEVYSGGSKYFDERLGKYKDIYTLYPDYISFHEYLYAKRSSSIASRRLVTEYDRLSSHSVFSYLIDLRNLCDYILYEVFSIRDILTSSFGEDYEDDSQKQVGVQLDSWAKMAIHYAQRINNAIIAPAGGIPDAEVDKITEKQAIEFQAFFAIRLDAVDDEIDSILQNIKRDLVDNSEIFYSRYLEQAINFKNNIVNSMELDFHTTSFSSSAPFLTEELVIATNVMNGNFGMILTDMNQRYTLINSKIDDLMRTISDKRKYSNYIFQLSYKGKSKKQIVKTVLYDPYKIIFKSSVNNLNFESDLISNHASLDNLLENHHPQYLLKDGGTITGDIFVENLAKIDGVHLSTHVHDGLDGSQKIKSTDIDYDTVRLSTETFVPKPLSISIDSFVNDIIDGGIPVMDVILLIESFDSSDSIEYEIIIAEVD